MCQKKWNSKGNFGVLWEVAVLIYVLFCPCARVKPTTSDKNMHKLDIIKSNESFKCCFVTNTLNHACAANYKGLQEKFSRDEQASWQLTMCCVNFPDPTEHWRSKSSHQLSVNRQRNSYQQKPNYLSLFHLQFWEIYEEKSVLDGP